MPLPRGQQMVTLVIFQQKRSDILVPGHHGVSCIYLHVAYFFGTAQHCICCSMRGGTVPDWIFRVVAGKGSTLSYCSVQRGVACRLP